MKRLLSTSLTAAVLSLVACGGGGSGSNAGVPDGVYIGAQLSTGTPLQSFNDSTGVKHALFGDFFSYPEVAIPGSGEQLRARNFINECVVLGAYPIITLESRNGLAAGTTTDAETFASFVGGFDTTVFVRFNHEMNGSWFAWGQQPSLYIAKFRELANALKENASNAKTLWAPNQGYGYPYAGGAYSIAASSGDFPLLDTNDDGTLTQADDPYTPYYPGDEYVDWVGVSFLHFGNATTNGINVIPDQVKFIAGLSVNALTPNFHDIFGVAHGKPIMVVETAAFFDPSDTLNGGATQTDVKEEWIDQVYSLGQSSPSIRDFLPSVHGIVWFNQLKAERDIGITSEWRIETLPEVIETYRNAVSDGYFVKGR